MSVSRRISTIVLTACMIAPLAAQAPEGWLVRIDRSQNAQDPDNTPDLTVTTGETGFRVVSGPAGTFWNPANATTGNYTAKATFTLMKPSGHVNYYGLIFGGHDIEGAAQQYTYFLVAQNGTYIVRHRSGDEVTDVQNRTPHTAIQQPGDNGQSTNALEVRASANAVAFVVNGTVVHTTPRADMPGQTDGFVGVRVNHQLDVQVENFEVQH